MPASLPDEAHADDVLASSERLFLYAIPLELRAGSRLLCSARLRTRTTRIPGKATRIQQVSLSFLLGDALQSEAAGHIPLDARNAAQATVHPYSYLRNSM